MAGDRCKLCGTEGPGKHYTYYWATTLSSSTSQSSPGTWTTSDTYQVEAEKSEFICNTCIRLRRLRLLLLFILGAAGLLTVGFVLKYVLGSWHIATVIALAVFGLCGVYVVGGAVYLMDELKDTGHYLAIKAAGLTTLPTAPGGFRAFTPRDFKALEKS